SGPAKVCDQILRNDIRRLPCDEQTAREKRRTWASDVEGIALSMKRTQFRRKFGMGVALLSAFCISIFGIVAVAGVEASAAAPAATHTVQDPAPSGDNGTTIDPLQYNCGNDA